ncbi:MAG: glycosyltransferase family 4 protein [Nocardioidaceae bacterium]
MTAVHAVVPGTIDDPARPSGGNFYDRRVLDGLRGAGWSVQEHAVAGSWPRPDAAALDALASVVTLVPDDVVLLVDGLVASSAPGVLVPAAARLRLVVLAHVPPVTSEVLAAASAVLTTSRWTRRVLLERHALSPGRIHVAEPGVEAAPLATGSGSGGDLLCVAAVTRDKGHLTLASALWQVADLAWRCTLVGSVLCEPGHVDRVRRRLERDGLTDRVTFCGALPGDLLAPAYASADLLVLPTRCESYGMVVTEALARGLPSLTTDVGGVPEALGVLPDGRRPGLLVRPGDPARLAVALRGWLTDPTLRSDLRDAARVRRGSLTGWSTTTGLVADVLAGVAA